MPPALAEPAFLAEGGEMGTRMRAYDWTNTPLGDPSGWPTPLKTIVGVVLSSKFPMFLTWGPDLTFLYNDGYIDVLGAKHPDALGRRFEDIWAEIWPNISPLVERAMAGESTYWENLPLTMRRKGYEEQTWFTFSYSPLRGEEGTVCGMFCTCIETTAALLAERRQVEEAERLRRLFDRAPSFIAVLRGPQHCFELANDAYMNLVGKRDLVGRTVREALPEVAGQGFFELLDQVYQSGEAFTGHALRINIRSTPDAEPEERLVDFVYQPMPGPAGDVDGIFVEGYDVTARHVAEAQLRESEERFRLIADSAPVPMWVTKLDRRRGFVNIAYAEFLGVSYEEAIDYDWRSRIHPEDIDRIVAESLVGEATLKPFVLEGRYLRADGEWRWLRSESQPRWGPQGEHVGFIGVAHDVTEAKAAEAALREMNEMLEERVAGRTADLRAALERLRAEVEERERAEEALRQAQKMEAVGQLTGGIAHDFNNLLTPIMGGLEMIARQVEDPRLKRIAEAALESSRRGAKLTGQLLAFSRIQRISMTPISVNAVIDNMRHIMGHTIGTSIKIRTELDERPAYAVCDMNQLENAILNLAINARDAMPDGGVLTISTGRSTQAAGPDLEEGEYAIVTVADTGHGMSPEVMARAMEPFFSTKALGKGTGLGLAQVYGIAHQSGGTVRIESEEGVGTSVHIVLPLADGPADAGTSDPDVPPSERPSAERACILIIDDDPDVRDFLAETLEGLGHAVDVSEGAEQGLARIEETVPDLVLLDFAMPGMNGAQAARRIRGKRPGLPIIFVTGYAESEQLEAALGPDVSVLRKPFGVDELVAVIAENLERAG
jgi:PAS domain S-box-containing protein